MLTNKVDEFLIFKSMLAKFRGMPDRPVPMCFQVGAAIDFRIVIVNKRQHAGVEFHLSERDSYQGHDG